MLVYANHLSFHGAGAEEAIFKAVGGWLKEKLGFGLHPEQLKQDGQFNGTRSDSRSWLRLYATDQDEPKLYAWVLTNADDNVPGRQWITELGLKIVHGSLELSCVLKTDERSTLVVDPVMASRPRVIPYIVNNIQQADNADFAATVVGVGVGVKNVGHDLDSYRGLLAEIERRDRDSPIVLVSPTRDGRYLINAAHLQQDLIGLAQVVQVSPEFNSYDMAEILGQPWSAWAGAVNVLHIPTQTGFVRGRFFVSDAIEGWGDTQHARISRLLAWVTNNTNISRLRNRIRPEGVMQLALRRRIQMARARSDQMDPAQLRLELEKAVSQVEDQDKYFEELANENARLESDVAEIKADLGDEKDKLAKKDFELQSLKDHLAKAGGERSGNLDAEVLLNLACCKGPPSPLVCVEAIESVHGDKCVVLETAKKSARDMNRFTKGRQLLDMLKRLATEYRSALIDGGDNKARNVFGKSEYAARESETVTGNRAMRRARTFEYRGEQIEMFRHLKIGIDDDASKTLRVHFHWDADRKKIIIGYCGEHLPVSGY